MNDLISRQELINRCDDVIENGISNAFGLHSISVEAVKDVVENMPSAQQWIPCSERLPEDIKPVIVTWKNNNPPFYYQHIVGEHFTGVAHCKNNKWFWYSSVTEDVLAEYGRCDSEEIDGAIEVVAWMPLPQPWKEVEDE